MLTHLFAVFLELQIPCIKTSYPRKSNKCETEEVVDLKKVHNIESCELSFIWCKMRSAARETASQIALRNCSKEAEGKVSIYVILVKAEYMQSSTCFLQNVSASLVQVTASHEEQTSP